MPPLGRKSDRLGPGAVQSFFGRWWRRLPSPFTEADVRAGHGYPMAFRPIRGCRHLRVRPAARRPNVVGRRDSGSPGCGPPGSDRADLSFHRRVRTPGTFGTRVISRGVDPTQCCYYQSSRVQPYFQQGRELHTETVVCNPDDFAIGRRVCVQHGNALGAVGESAHRCLGDAAAADA